MIFNMKLSKKYHRKEAKPIKRKSAIIQLLIVGGEILTLILTWKYFLAPELAKWLYYYGALIKW